MKEFARLVLGYHGCRKDFAEKILSGEIPIREWTPSQNPYDWIGHGIYFWEHAPARAMSWGKNEAVIGAVIQLGNCLDLTDILYTNLLSDQFEITRQDYESRSVPLPVNKGKSRKLDCLIVNCLLNEMQEIERFQTVRCPFLEGTPAFDGSMILTESHIQVSVVDRSCLVGVFRPNLDEERD